MNCSPSEARLEEYLARYESVIIAFSGGVDSSYLAFLGNRVLGFSAICFTGLSPAVSTRQRRLAEEFASRHGLNHHLLETSEMEQEEYRRNPTNRCYFCKSELYSLLEAQRLEIDAQVILDGTNADDLSDFRPGRQAAMKLGVESPLARFGMTKKMIRDRSRFWGLETWDLPAMPCLSSRFPYGTEITSERLQQVEDSEEILWKLGFRNFRVRFHDSMARLEVAGNEMDRFSDPALMMRIDEELRRLGFSRVTLDLRGFRSGSLNDEI